MLKFYRAAMMEFEINMSEMPLGKLSKTNIQKGTFQRILYNFCAFLFDKHYLIIFPSCKMKKIEPLINVVVFLFFLLYIQGLRH